MGIKQGLIVLSSLCVVGAVVAVIMNVSFNVGTTSGESSQSFFGTMATMFNFTLSTDDTIVCWKDTYGRGVGTVPTSCPSGQENNAGLCYPLCKSDFYGVGPVCWQYCPTGWIDEGALCREPGSIKTIAKQSYGRGVGKMPICASDQVEDSGLCYTDCKSGYDGVGPVCWEQCPTIDPTDGGAVCCRNATVCTEEIRNLSEGLPLAVLKIILAGGDITKIVDAVKQAIEALVGFILPLCDQL